MEWALACDFPPLPLGGWGWAFVLGMESGEAWAAGSEARGPLFQDKGPAGPFVWRLAETVGV